MSPLMNQRFWAGGFGYPQNLAPFLKSNRWSFTSPPATVRQSAPKDWAALTQIKVGDGFAIKGYGGRNRLNVHLVGEVAAINRTTGEIQIKPWPIRLFSDVAPKVGTGGNWFRALTSVTSAEAIRAIFDVEISDDANSSEETASRAKTFFGESAYQIKAREVLPHLVALAEAGSTTFYQDLAQVLNMPNPRNLNYVLGSVGQTLIELGKQWGIKIPPIQSLVINRAEQLPGEGVGFFMDTDDYAKLTLSAKRVVVGDIHHAIWAFPRWRDVLAAFSLPAFTPPPVLKPGVVPPSGGAGFGNHENNKLVEQAAISFVTKYLEKQGYAVASREKECIGYDLDAKHPALETLHVEVKGVSGGDVQFPITANEVRCATYDPAFNLYVVTGATSVAPKLHTFSGADIKTGFNLVPLSYMASLKGRRS